MTARIAGFDSRATLKMRAPRSISKNITPSAGGVGVHYGGNDPNPAPTSHAQCQAVWRGWQNYHMDGHGWVDIAYTSGFCNHGYVLAGRGYGVRTAANGTNDANQRYYAFVWVGGGNAVPSNEALDALDWLINDARKNGGAGKEVKPHRVFYATSCPGTVLTDRAHARDGAAIPGVTPTAPRPPASSIPHVPSEPAYPLPTRPRLHWYGRNDGTAYSHSGMNPADRPNIKKIQQKLIDRGWAVPMGADGYFGDKTAAVVIRYQKYHHLVADGKVGPKTWSDLL